jgi:hypothetical protein
MSNNASRSSLYEEITLEKGGVTPVALEGRTVRFSYFESLFSPYVEANLTYIDTGNGLSANGTDTQERLGTIKSSFPINARGEETVKFKITNTLGSLDFSSNPLVVNDAPTLIQESKRELVTLKLVSRAEIRNQNESVDATFYNSISNSVSTILTQNLQIPANRIFIDPTQNSLSFGGNRQKPFKLILFCAKQAKPLQGSAGYLFWETQSGFNFRAVDNLIAQKNNSNLPRYKYHGVNPRLNEQQKNFRILAPPTVAVNQDLLKQLRAGSFKTLNTGYNLQTGQYFTQVETLNTAGLQTLGTSLNEFSNAFTTGNVIPKINFFVQDVGNSETGISTAVNNNPFEHIAKASMRYNLLLAQVFDITVPANPSLKAGDVIYCEFEKITLSNLNEGSTDQRFSGPFVIAKLVHYFSPRNSFTHMRLVTDSFGGLYTGGGTS